MSSFERAKPYSAIISFDEVARIGGRRNLGLFGGLGHGATIHYHRELVKARGGEMLIVHAQDLPVDAIMLAGTDLALIFNETNTDFPHIDCARVHIQAILRVLGEGH
jgi:aspartate/glutamate racemase